MMSVTDLVARGRLSVRSLIDGDDNSDYSKSDNRLIDGMVVVLIIAFVSILLSSIFLGMRRYKRMQRIRAMGLPQYNQSPNNVNNCGGLTIETTGVNGRHSVLVFNRDGQPMLSNPQSPPHSPDNVPEIRITFPDEHDETGQRKSGRVVVVRVGDATVGLEPLAEADEQLPAYEKESKGRFYSIDMNDIGGLKEKSRTNYQ